MRKTEYIYPKMKFASSYQKRLVQRIEELKLMGAKLEIKEYASRPPAWSVAQDGWTGTELKNLESLLIVIKGPGKDGRVAASTYITKEHYYKTVKVSERADADVMLASIDQLLEHIDDYVRAKTNQ
jgi:hypothetical protein